MISKLKQVSILADFDHLKWNESGSLFLHFVFLLQEAYRRWVCSSLVPHFSGPGLRVRPCLNVCQNVEQQCPYMLPGDRAPAYPTQYAGEPTFLCLGEDSFFLSEKLFSKQTPAGRT